MNENPPTLGVPQIKRLNGLPRGRMTAQQRLDALRKVQEQAEQRTQLGARLLSAAQQTFAEQQDMVNALRDEQKQLRDELQADMARSFQQYDQYLGDISGGVAQRLEELAARLSRIESDWSRAQERIERFMHRAESLMEESRNLLVKTREVREGAADAPQAQGLQAQGLPALGPNHPQAPETQPIDAAPPAACPGDEDPANPASPADPPAVTRVTEPPREASLVYTEIIDRLRARCREQQRRASTQPQ